MAQLKAIVDKLLTNVSSGYIPKGYLSEQYLPNVPVIQDTGKLGKYGDQHIRLENDVMAGEGEARRVNPIVRTDSSYEILHHGLEGIVTEADKRNVEKPFEAERDVVMGLTTQIWLSKEKVLADALGDTAVLTQNVTLSGTSQFNDYVNSDPLDRFKTARLAIYDSVGMPPDTASMPWDVFNTLAYHPGILDALGFTANRAGQLSEAELAKALGVQRLLVGMAQFNSATEGQTDVRANVWGKNVVFSVSPSRAELFQTSLGYYLTLKSRKPREVFKFEVNNPPQATGIIVRDSYDMFLSNTSAGYLIKDAIA